MSEQIIQPPKATPVQQFQINMEGKPVKVFYEGVEALMVARGTWLGVTPVFLLLQDGLGGIIMIANEYVRAVFQTPIRENVEAIKASGDVEILIPDEVAIPVDKEPDGDDVA